MKFLLIVVDGMGDRGRYTPLSQARKPNLDFLAKNGRSGLLDIGYEKTVNSDFGFLNILGSYSKQNYPGRGYLEALGINLHPGSKDVCIRGNFATISEDGNLIDRRAGRDETGLDGFAEKLDGMEIDGIRFRVKKSSGHRVVIIMQGKGLSDQIIPNDPLKVGVPVPEVKPVSRDAKFTAHVLNKFITRVNKILSKEPVNKKRELPANLILIRNTGRKKTVSSFEKRFGLRACCIAGIPIAKGVARFLGMDVIEVSGATGDPQTNLDNKTRAVIHALKTYSFIFLHINGADILSHSAKRKQKKEFIEKIDKHIGKILKQVDLKNMVFIITCDHRTNSLPQFKHYRHIPDPVPVLISGNQIPPDKIKNFDEHSAEHGSLKIKKTGLMPLVFGIVNRLKRW
jgi:2,3-bisphosphoglycerate-independent phosphoglycerate mutase